MRVLLLYDCLYPETIGGVEHRNLQLAESLARRGHAVTLAACTDQTTSGAEGVGLVSLGRPHRGRRGLLATLRFARATARLDLEPYDVIETANIPYAHVPLLAQRCRVAGKPLVVTWHEYWGPTWRRHLGWLWPAAAAVEAASTHAGTAVAVSQLTAGRVARRRRRPVELLPNGVAVRAVREAAARGARGADAPPLVSAGRLLPEKRLDLLLAALAQVKTPRTGELLSIFGEGPARASLEALADRLGISARVRFAGRAESPTELWRELGSAQVAVVASAREGFGLFPLEAMAAGLPVVACHAEDSAVPELVRDGTEGLVTDPEPAALATALQRLLLDERLRGKMAAAAVRRAEEYDWESVAARAEAVFRRAAEIR